MHRGKNVMIIKSNGAELIRMTITLAFFPHLLCNYRLCVMLIGIYLVFMFHVEYDKFERLPKVFYTHFQNLIVLFALSQPSLSITHSSIFILFLSFYLCLSLALSVFFFALCTHYLCTFSRRSSSLPPHTIFFLSRSM